MGYSCNKTNEMHHFLKFIFGIGLYMFRTVSPSIVRSLAHTAIASSQHNLYDIYHCCVYSARLLMMDGETAQNV